MTLVDATGDEAGVMRWVTRSLDAQPQAGETSLSMGNCVMSLNGGKIHWRALGEQVNPASEVDTPNIQTPTGAELGGTGIFAGARGTVEILREDGAAFAIDISCEWIKFNSVVGG